MALKSGNDSSFTDTIKTFVEEQNNMLPTYVKKVENLEGEMFESARNLQFGIIDMNKNTAFKNIVNSKVTVQNPRIMIYLSGQKKVSFYNNIDDALDTIEDIKAGEFEGVRISKKYFLTFFSSSIGRSFLRAKSQSLNSSSQTTSDSSQ